MITEKEFKERCAEILRKEITFSHQVGDYVIHGALDSLWKLHTEQNSHKHGVMQGLLPKCPHCQGTGIDPEIPNYEAPLNSSPAVGNSAVGQSGSGGFCYSWIALGNPVCKEQCERCKQGGDLRGGSAKGALPY